jgi:hypothetical protein
MHGFVYDWTPNNEIWLEAGEHTDELKYILLHEYVERIEMKYQHTPYDKAHSIASKIEWHYRNKPFSKQKALSLSKNEALKLIKQF